MATTFYSSTVDGCRCKCTYSVSSTNTTTTVSGTIYFQHKGSAKSWILGMQAGVGLILSYSKPVFYEVEISQTYEVSKHSDWTTIKSKSFSFTETREHSAFTMYLHAGIVDFMDSKGDAYKSVSIPAKPSYSVQYYSQGSLFLSDKKYYNESYSISYTMPSRKDYRFLYWNTSSDGTGTRYEAGDVYASGSNTGLTLYAIWGAMPIILSITAIRSNAEGVEDPQSGTYASISCDWRILSDTATLTGVLYVEGGTSIPFIFSSGGSGTGGTAEALVPGINVDKQYIVEITATNDSEPLCYTKLNELLTKAQFVMDFKSGGRGVGIGRAAPETGLEIGYDTRFFGTVTNNDDTLVNDIYAGCSPDGVGPVTTRNGYFTGDIYVGCNADSSGGSKLVKEGALLRVVEQIYSNRSWASGTTNVGDLNYTYTPPAGYTVAGIVGAFMSINGGVIPQLAYYGGKLHGYVRNVSSSALTDHLYVRFLLVKSELM